MENYYEILNVNKVTPPNEIKKSFRKLAFKFHPDKNLTSSNSDEKFKQIVRAYETLIDHQKRVSYDILLEQHIQLKEDDNFEKNNYYHSYDESLVKRFFGHPYSIVLVIVFLFVITIIILSNSIEKNNSKDIEEDFKETKRPKTGNVTF